MTKWRATFLFALLLCLSPVASCWAAVRLNEVMASNGQTLADEDGDFSDWIELVNTGADPVLLQGWGLSDRLGSPFRWVFPEVTLDPGGFLLVWASGKDRRDPTGELHAEFSIASEGESLLLTRPDGVRVDTMPVTAIPRDVSFGRVPGDPESWFYFAEPTPGAANTSQPYVGILDPPAFSVPPGVYADPVVLDVVHPDPHVTVHYTVDGSRPDDTAAPWDSARVLGSRAGDPNVFSRIRTTPDEPVVLAWGFDWKEPLDVVRKAHAVRVVAVRDGYLPSPVQSATWFVGPGYEQAYAVDLVSLIADPDDLFGPHGIYVPGQIYEEQGFGEDWWGGSGNYFQRGSAWARPAHLEFYRRSDGRRRSFGDVDIRIHGGVSRAQPQKSLRLYDQGSGALSFPFFDEREGDFPYRRLLLRNSGQDWYAYIGHTVPDGYRHGPTMLRDAYLQRLVRHLDFEYQAYRPTVLFLNGEYWGIHNLRERIDRFYLARLFDANPDRIDLLSGNARPQEGSADHYLEMMDFLRLYGVSDASNYRRLQTMMDTASYTDYLMTQIFFNNLDWPGANIDYWRSHAAYDPALPPGYDGRWRWILYDLDNCAFAWLSHWNMFASLNSATEGHPRPAWSLELIGLLWESHEFRRGFVSRFVNHLNSTFLSSRAHALMDDVAEAVEGEIVEHFRRWGRDITLDEWRLYLQTVKRFFEERPAYVREHMRAHMELGPDAVLSIANASPRRGVVSVDGMRLDQDQTPGVSGRPTIWRGTFFEGIPITLTAVPDRDSRFSHWAGLGVDTPQITFAMTGSHAVEAVFEPAPPEELLHYWSFNAEALTPTLTVGGGRLRVAAGAETETTWGTGRGFFSANGRLGETAGTHLRLNHPLGAQVDLRLPTTGFENVVLTYEARRSAQGPGLHYVGYTVDGETYLHAAAFALEDDAPQVFTLDFSDRPETFNEPRFGVRIGFIETASGGQAGNARIDNIVLEGIPSARIAHAAHVVLPEVTDEGPPMPDSSRDFDGDGAADMAVYHPGSGTWHVRYSGGGAGVVNWGWNEAIPVPGDYDGDGVTDIAVYHPGSGTWHIRYSGGGADVVNWGWSEAVPVPGDYNGDGATDIAVYHPGSGTWHILYSGGGAAVVNWGWSEALPVPGDYDGDGATDIAVYHPETGTWHILYSDGGHAVVNWGWSEAVPVPGDYDGDGATDIAVYHPGSGTWHILYSDGGHAVVNWGWSEAVPVPGDYDGDGVTDIAVYHPGSGTWHILYSGGGDAVVNWGWNEAVPARVPMRPEPGPEMLP